MFNTERVTRPQPAPVPELHHPIPRPFNPEQLHRWKRIVRRVEYIRRLVEFRDHLKTLTVGIDEQLERCGHKIAVTKPRPHSRKCGCCIQFVIIVGRAVLSVARHTLKVAVWATRTPRERLEWAGLASSALRTALGSAQAAGAVGSLIQNSDKVFPLIGWLLGNEP